MVLILRDYFSEKKSKSNSTFLANRHPIAIGFDRSAPQELLWWRNL